MPADHITRYDIMPIPPVEAQTEWFDAGPVRIGVEYRLLNDAIAAASGSDEGVTGIDDRGVSLHVLAGKPGKQVEHLRFDCFLEDPHYHYVSLAESSNEMIHMDPIADGDPLVWALERIRTRLPQMLERAGADPDVDTAALERVLPRITEAAWRLRYHHDDDSVLHDALDAGTKAS